MVKSTYFPRANDVVAAASIVYGVNPVSLLKKDAMVLSLFSGTKLGP